MALQSSVVARLFFTVCGSVLLLPIALAQAFPVATPESQGLSSASLERLSQTIQKYVDRNYIVGAEMMVIKNRKTVLHQGFGWRDREEKDEMEIGSIFNIRSMTKPLTGAALQMLIEEGKVGIDDRASKYLTEFDTDTAREITVRQLLTHRSGMPLTLMASLTEYENLAGVAKAGGEVEMKYKPGEQFFYSDGGTDVVAAIVERVSGLKIDEFVSERLFKPLGMDEAFYVWDESKVDRLVSLYGGARGQWSKMWDAKKALYPFAWGSQTIYSTTTDYAKFLAMWMDGGVAGGERVLSEATLARGHSPVSEMGTLGGATRMPNGFTGLGTYYGEMAQLWFSEPLVDGALPVVIGHTGSDGTLAYAWPEEDLMVLFFTQSRGQSGLLRVETMIDATIREKDTVDAPFHVLPKCGTYLANFGTFKNEEFQVMFINGQLSVEIPAQFIAPLVSSDEDFLWTIQGGGGAKIEFADAVNGECPMMYLVVGPNRIELPRGVAPELVIRRVTLEEVEKFLGKYLVPDDGSEVEIILKDGELKIATPEAGLEVALMRVDGQPNVWLVSGSVPLVFIIEDGEVVSFKVVLPDGTEMVRTKIKSAHR